MSNRLQQLVLLSCLVVPVSVYVVSGVVTANQASPTVTVVLTKTDALRLRTALARSLGPKQNDEAAGYQRRGPRAVGLDDEDHGTVEIDIPRQWAEKLLKAFDEGK